MAERPVTVAVTVAVTVTVADTGMSPAHDDGCLARPSWPPIARYRHPIRQ